MNPIVLHLKQMLTIFINRYCVVNRNRMSFPLIDDLIHVLAYLMPELAMPSSYKLNQYYPLHAL